MSDDRCAAFGPAHHYLTGAALLTCLRNAQGGAPRAGLADDLEEMEARASQVPGASCARWGVCGAAASAGMAYAIASGNQPLEARGWSEGQRMVAELGLAIADAGAPRCCKRDVRIAAAHAAETFERAFGVCFSPAPLVRDCSVSNRNTVCIGNDCPYFGGGA